ncbi:MAG TPA: hypothetical protein VG758_09925 [Hyphomicrobiaceae bacterium]|nr:hypothetical protein [Hyphomicrobiaceae bacterium]
MPNFDFALEKDGKQFPLAEAVQLPDNDAAHRHAKLAILKVFPATSSDDWSGWQLSIREDQSGEVGQITITDLLTKLGWRPGGTGKAAKRLAEETVSAEQRGQIPGQKDSTE